MSDDRRAPARRVLWLIRGLGPGGAERLLVNHARSSSGRFHYEVAFDVAGKDQLVPELAALGVAAHRLAPGPHEPAALRALVREREIDLVHSHSPAMGAMARVALRAVPGGPRPKLVYTEHNRWGAYRWPTRWANELTYPLEDHILAVSEEARRSVVAPLRHRVQTLHHGVDASAVRARAGDPAATRASLGVKTGHLLVAHVANYRVEKAHEVLVAAAKLLADAEVPIHFVLVGQGPTQPDIEALVAREGLAGTVEILGFRPDVEAILAAADALVLSSDHEGLPVVVMEAFAVGTPVVATEVGGLPEAITDGESGLLVPPRDPAALAAGLRRLIDEPGLREQLARGAARRASAFDAATATATVEGVYARLLS